MLYDGSPSEQAQGLNTHMQGKTEDFSPSSYRSGKGRGGAGGRPRGKEEAPSPGK